MEIEDYLKIGIIPVWRWCEEHEKRYIYTGGIIECDDCMSEALKPVVEFYLKNKLCMKNVKKKQDRKN